MGAAVPVGGALPVAAPDRVVDALGVTLEENEAVVVPEPVCGAVAVEEAVTAPPLRDAAAVALLPVPEKRAVAVGGAGPRNGLPRRGWPMCALAS